MGIRGFFAGFLLLLWTLCMGPASHAGVFYCGTVEYVYDEKADVHYEKSPKGGGHTKIHESMIFQYGVKWPICLACGDMGDLSMALCSGRSSAPVQPFQYSKNEDGEWLQAEQICNDRPVRPGDLTQETKTTRGAPPNEARISAMLSVIGSEYHFMVSPADGDDIPRISVTNQWHKKTVPRCAPPKEERGGDSLLLPLPILFTATQPWVSGDSLSGILPIQNVEGCKDSDSEYCKGIGAEGTVQYSLINSARWNLKRKVTDCTARVTNQTRGDVRLNGEPLPKEGAVPLAPGDVIATGGRSRAEFKISNQAVLRVGPSSSVQLNRNLCKSKPTSDMTKDLVLGPASELLLQIMGLEFEMPMEMRTVTVGVRGALDPADETAWMPVSFAYPSQSNESPSPEQIAVPSDWPEGGRAAYLKSYEDGVLVVKALRGRVRVADPDARRTIDLKPGEMYRSPAMPRRNSVTVTMLMK